MISWEPVMSSDLFPFFSVPTTSTLTSFEDRIVGNRDARAAVDSKGNVLFVYSFYNSKYIIVAQNEAVLKSVQDVLLRQNL